MKLPSIEQVLQESSRTLQRFPLVITSSVVGTLSALVLADYETPPVSSELYKVLAAAILGILLLTVITLFAEGRKWSRSKGWGMQALGAALLVPYALSIPTALIGAPLFHLLRLQMLAIALLLLVIVAPNISKGAVARFWDFNKTLLFRLLTTALFSLVLYAGLAVALAALENLFGMDIPGRRYLQLWILVVGVFAMWFFLAGVPDGSDSADAPAEYPKSLRVFAQYILLPLVFVYFIILYAYLGKILIGWSWPQGWVSRLILGFSSTGLISLLLLYPIRDRAENLWIRTAWRWFFVVLIPLIIVLLLAVWRRISEYGITEARYIAIVYGLWLAAMVAYFMLSRTKSIRVIPGSLCVLAMLISFGPWGAFQVSEKSQINRLRELLTRDSILVNEKVQVAPQSISPEDRGQISAIIGYLHMFHGYDRIQPWFAESLKQEALGAGSTYKDPIFVTQMMGIVYDPYWQGTSLNATLLRADPSVPLNIDGYHGLLRRRSVFPGSAGKVYQAGAISYRVSGELDTLTFMIVRNGEISDSLRISLRELIDRIVQSGINANSVPPDELSVSGASDSLRVKVCLQQVRLKRLEGKIKPEFYEAEILYSIGEKGE